MKAVIIVLACATVALPGLGIAADAPKPAIAGTGPKAMAPVPGKNSFTQGEARSRMERAGFALANDPVKNDDGIWRAEATRGSEKVRVLMDYQGNVFRSAALDKPVPGPTKLKSDDAQKIMEQRGYALSSIPIKDDQGIWYAEGHLNNQPSVQVMVDHQGNVFESTGYTGHPNSAPGTPTGPFKEIDPAAVRGMPAPNSLSAEASSSAKSSGGGSKSVDDLK